MQPALFRSLQQTSIQLLLANRGNRRRGNTRKKAAQALRSKQLAGKWQQPGKGRDARTRPNPPTPTAAILSGSIFPKSTTPYKPKNFKPRCRPGITGCQPSSTPRFRKSRFAARPGKTHPARGLSGFLTGFPDEQFGAPFCRGKTSQKQATKRAGSGGLLTKNQRSNIPSYFLESFDAPDALNGLAAKRRSNQFSNASNRKLVRLSRWL